MINPAALGKMAREIKNIHARTDVPEKEELIEAYLQETLQNLLPNDRVMAIEQLISVFSEDLPEVRDKADLDTSSSLLSLLLGEKVWRPELSTSEAMDKLVRSLNAIFDSINQIVHVIHATLLGEKVELQTIRHRIGASLEDKRGLNSLQAYLDQIRIAFLISHEGFKKAIQIKVSEILKELDPDQIATTVEGGIRFGLLRKAELYDAYKDRFKTCEGWFKSGRFLEEILREFEKSCRKNYKSGIKEVL